ncbi:leucyl aminopeptidase [Sphingomonas sp. SUN039]|uniref:leucyl aminopeptidase n=1 Tax=Sphingomonas sp. SUN039 TaxID=2937787 RepID=UPI0021644050|nr:leucyl aminopeptidase [Sphingomonas sp. SUN039]UVO53328.1 leucyl aminopeptidase [Sphingomonas sp. SUN039]
MNVEFAPSRPDTATTVVLPVAKGVLAERIAGEAAAEGLRAAASLARFEGEAGSIAEYVETRGGVARRILLLGTGSANESDAVKAGSALTAKLLTSGETALVLDAGGVATPVLMRMLEGVVLRGWRYDRYRTRLPATQKPTLDRIVVASAGDDASAAWTKASAVIDGVSFARELVTEPANIIYPESFVERCQRLAAMGVELQVLDEAAMAAAGMGALLGVGQGSERPSRLLVMKWDGTGGAAKTPVVFVGKGVTFDTGGISLKPPAGMEDMKWDMGGAAAVAGAMMALAGRKANAYVVGVCGLVENMPDGKAQRPGDVVTSMSGQTIEVINTDAEGRLVLCDAITWVQKNYSPKVLVDLATLTGAMIVSLGHEHGGIFANDDALATQLVAAGGAVGDPLWRMPLGEAYNKLIDSPIADMKNVGPREGGSITAAQFLQRFIDEGVAWAHLDIAGMVWASKPGPGWDKGATGYGVRLLDRYIADNHEG